MVVVMMERSRKWKECEGVEANYVGDGMGIDGIEVRRRVNWRQRSEFIRRERRSGRQ